MRDVEKRKDERIMNNGIFLMTCCVFCFVCFMSPVLSQAQYPWESDTATQKTKSVQKTPPSPQYNTSQLSKQLTFGVFKARVPDSWIEFPAAIDPELEGQAILKMTFDGTSINITVDEDPFTYSDDSDLVLYEEILSKNIGKNSQDAIRHMNIMGNKTLIIREFDEDDGSTLFYVFPYDGAACHPTYVVYEQRVNRLTEEVKAILSTLQFRE
jgi:hypothetical protein